MEEAWAQLRFQLCEMSAFELELGDIEVFPITNVIYISILKGFEQLQGMHQQLNCGCVSFSEPFHYHPHITLAQEVPGCEVPAVLDIARRRWRECRYSRAFDLDCLTFVQNSIVPETGASRWLDLASVELQPRPVKVG
jgi:2'-5' RNA ligase